MARYEPGRRVAAAGIGVAAVVVLYPWRWDLPTAVPPSLVGVVLFVLLPAAVGALVRSLVTALEPALR